MLRDRITRLLELARDARTISSSDAPWQTKYDVIFSAAISGAVKELGFTFDWYDPDTSYEEDVLAYVTAIEEQAEKLRPILRALENAVAA